jgi:hypothetical protein
MQRLTMILGILALFVICVERVNAAVDAVDLGTGSPPATLGGYTMAAYEPGTIAGETEVAHIVGGNGTDFWATWGQGYTGLVHVVLPASPLTISLSGVQAVDFYEEPDLFSNFDMTATDSSGATVTTLINGYYGSSGVGFYETNPSDSLTSITVTCTDASGFAIGEFGLNAGGLSVQTGTPTAPEPSTLVIFGGLGIMGLIGGYVRRRVTMPAHTN